MRTAIILFIALIISPIAFSKTINVPGDYNTIQEAINAALNGDTVLVHPGTYFENIDFNGKAIVVQSSGGPNVSVIDGKNQGSVVTFQSNEGLDSVLEGFNITNGSGSTFPPHYIIGGGGILCLSSSPWITKCTINGNTTGDGGGILLKYSSAWITDCILSKNIASHYGGGICCSWSSTPWITRCTISSNTAPGGAGIYCDRGTSPEITNCIISKNEASDSGGGICCRYSWPSITKPLITNCTFSENNASSGGGIYCEDKSSPTVINTILWDDDASSGSEIWIGYKNRPSTLTISYSDVKGGASSAYVDPGSTLNWGPGMIEKDPLFVTGPYGYYYLSQAAAGQPTDSPCVDTGSDLAGNLGMDVYWTRNDGVPDAGIVDMGFHYGNFIFPALQTNTTFIAEGIGGDAVFLLNGGMDNANRNFILLGSMTGTDPGTLLPGGNATLPLNWDLFTNVIIDYINTPIFSDFMGTLDGTGSATATFDTLQPIPGMGGTTMHFAYALNNPWNFVSNPVGITIIPSDVNWRQYGFDAQNTGYNPYETILGPSTVNKLQVQWSRSFSSSVYSPPAVVDGVVFMGTYSSNFYALDAETGATLWQRNVDGCTGGPAVYDGIVYVGSRHSPLVYALDTKDGSIVWSLPVTEIIVDTSPTVVNGIVYICTATGSGERFYALNAKTGIPLWTVNFPIGELTTPTVAEGIVYVAHQYNIIHTLYAFDAGSGNPLWEAPVSRGDFERLPWSQAVSEGVVYSGSSDGHLCAFDAITGNLMWKGKTGGLQVDSPAVANGLVYVASNDSKFYAFDVQTHQIKWSTTTKSDVRGKPTVANGVVYITEAEGPKYVYAFNAKTGGLIWEYDLGSLLYNTFTSPTVVNGKMYVPATFNYSIYAFHIP